MVPPPLLLPWLLGACEPILPPVFVVDSGVDFDPERPLLVSVDRLDFGAVVVNAVDPLAPPSQDVTITNLSDQEQAVYGYALIEGDDAGVFSVDAEPYFILEGGKSRTLPVRFRPQTAASHEGTFAIEGGTSAVTLRGQGLAPVIDLESNEPVGVAVGCDASFSVTIRNTGDQPLLLSEARLQGGDDFTLPESLGLQTLAAGGWLQLPVRFAPFFSWSNSAEYTDVLEVDSNDPLYPTAQIALRTLYTRGPQVQEVFTYYPGMQVDLLLVVDNTGIMSARIQKAEEAIRVLVDTLLSAHIELHAAVISGADDCPITQTAFLSSESASESAINTLLIDGLYGPSGTGSAALLSLAAEAAGNAGPGGCLEGFLRKGALLHTVVISGGDDASGVDVDDQLNAIRAAAPDADGVMISALVGTDPGGCAGLSYGAHYLSASLLTDGVQGSACDNDWAPAFEEMALASALLAEGSADVVLQEEPVPETLRVTVDGDLYTGWSYTADPPTLHFPQATPPDTGSAVVVDYLAAVPCDDSAAR